MKISARLTSVVVASALASTMAAARAQQQTPPPQTPPAQQPPAQQPPAQQPPQDPDRAQQPIRTGINFIRVDVIVSDGKGNPILDLKPEDFSISEDGKAQKIESFTVVKIDEKAMEPDAAPTSIRNDADEEREAARPEVRLFTILLDDYHVRRGNDMSVRKPLMDFVQNQLGPLDMVAVMYPLTPAADIRFTRNRDSLISAIQNFEGRKFNYQPRNQFEEQIAYYPAATVERIRTQITMGALKAAAVRMGGLREGRKSIIFVSEGFTSTLPSQLNDPVSSMPGLGNPRRGRPGADVVNETQEFFNEAEVLTDMRDVYEIANRQNTSIYAVDPRGLAAFEYGINEGVSAQVDKRGLDRSLDSLRVLAANTDGRAIVNRNDLASGMRQIIRDSSGYYLLGYNSTQAPTDGKFHEIKVRVNRRGVDVRARKGYWAYTAEEAAKAMAPPKPEPPKAVTSALASIAEPARGRPARFWIGTAQGANGRTRVTFAWEPIAATSGGAQAADEQAARVSVTAVAPDGRSLFRGKVPEMIVEDNPGATGDAKRSISFDAPPGQIQLRINVEGSRGQVIDSVTRELTLPDFTQVTLAFATPRVFRGRTVRDLSLIKANPEAIPTPDRDFSRAERILIRIDAYAPGGQTPVLTARLLNRGGDKMADLPVQPAAPGKPFDIELPLSGLAAGEYIIELNAKTDAGSAQELIAFKVGR